MSLRVSPFILDPRIHSLSRLKVMGQLEELSISVLEKLAAVIIEDNDKKAKKTKRIIVQLADRKRTLPDG